MNTPTSEINFFVINTVPLWQEGEKIENIRVEEHGITLEKSGGYSYTDTHFPGCVTPKSLDCDACGVLYILDGVKKGIMVYEVENRYYRWLECLSFNDPVSIAVSDRDIYVVDGDKLYCLARVNGQIRWEVSIRDGIGIRAAGLEPDRLYVLDINEKKVFRTGREWDPAETEEIALTAAGPDGGKVPYPLDTKVPVDIASDREGCFYILEAQHKEILKFDPGGLLTRADSIPFEGDAVYKSLAVESGDNVYLVFTGETAGGSGGFEPGVIGGIVRIGKSVGYAVSGTYIGKVFDSTVTGCLWHRVVLEADIPANTRVILSYAASDHGPGIDGPFTSDLPANPADTLINGAVGRYIRFRIELSSDEARGAAPLVKGLKVYFPRLTYLRYLPETFREDDKGREFLERFLSLFETFMSRSEERIFGFTRYLDPLAAPGEFIPWLSSWLAIAYDENWPLEKKRLLIRRAPGLHKRRGTPGALSQIIELFYGNAPVIIEPFQLACPGNREASEPYLFTVLVPPRWEDPGSRVKIAKEVTGVEIDTLRRIVDLEKPAHTEARLQVLQPWFYLDMYTYLEINTLLSRSEFVLGKSSVLGRDTVLHDIEPAGQAGRKSRIGIDLMLI